MIKTLNPNTPAAAPAHDNPRLARRQAAPAAPSDGFDGPVGPVHPRDLASGPPERLVITHPSVASQSEKLCHLGKQEEALRLLGGLEGASCIKVDGSHGWPVQTMAHFLLEMAEGGHPAAEQLKPLSQLLEWAACVHMICDPVGLERGCVNVSELPWQARWCIEEVSVDAAQRLAGGRTLLAAWSYRHAILLDLHKQPNDTFTASIYNAGEGLSRHEQLIGRKYSTIYQRVGIPKENVGEPQLRELLNRTMADTTSGQRGVESIGPMYEWVTQLGGREPIDAHAIVQSAQDVGNCTHKCVLAFLRHNLPSATYHEVRAAYYKSWHGALAGDVAKAAPTARAAQLLEAFGHKVDRAEHKRDRSRRMAELVREGKDYVWFTDMASLERPPYYIGTGDMKAMVQYSRRTDELYLWRHQDGAPSKVRLTIDVSTGAVLMSNNPGSYPTLQALVASL